MHKYEWQKLFKLRSKSDSAFNRMNSMIRRNILMCLKDGGEKYPSIVNISGKFIPS